MTCNETRNWFADDSLAQDPYPFLAELRSQCPVQPTPHHDVVAVTGYEEASEILRRHDELRADLDAQGDGGIARPVRPLPRGGGRLANARITVDRRPYPRLW